VPLFSIRTRVTLFSIVFGLLLIGVVTVASYVLIGSGMARAAEGTGNRLADIASTLLSERVAEATRQAASLGLTGDAADEYVADVILGRTPDSLTYGSMFDGWFALYYRDAPTAPLELAWRTDHAVVYQESPVREEALSSRERAVEFPDQWPALSGLFVSADLGTYTVHVPVDLPGVAGAVLDVTYIPQHEMSVINAMRLPMALVALVALILSFVISKAITGWALSLVRDLTEAANSIEVGRFDVRLPAEGKNEVAELARSLNGLIDTLRRGHEAQTRFVADASHELATPVAGIRGYVNILREWGAEDPAVRQEALDAIDRESARMARLCRDLLSLIRSEETVEYQDIRYDINTVCRQALAAAATRYLERQLHFAGPTKESLWLMGDPDRVGEAIDILIDNACKYTSPGGNVTVRTRRDGKWVIVEVSDTGIGIPEDDLPFIFERFYRSDQSRSSQTGGFGLGLSIANRIIETSGGYVTCSSRVGFGTTFRFALPKRKTEAPS